MQKVRRTGFRVDELGESAAREVLVLEHVAVERVRVHHREQCVRVPVLLRLR